MHISVTFPLGVYYAESTSAMGEPEWPPHPVRLIGALIAAANSPDNGDIIDDAMRAIGQLCEAEPPRIATGQEPTDPPHVEGPSRWASRNYFSKGRREKAKVYKGGVVIDSAAVVFDWPGLDLDPSDLSLLRRLCADVSFLGTSRSPVLVELDEAQPPTTPQWTTTNARSATVPSRAIRVPNARTVEAYETRHQARQSSKDRVESATTAVPGIPIGEEIAYAHSADVEQAGIAHDPQCWGEIIVLAIDADRSEIVPRAEASYQVARAFRTSLLGAFEDAGNTGDAPPILRGHGADPHCAIVPLANIWHAGAGDVHGVAIVLPHPTKVDDLAVQRTQLEEGLARLLPIGGADQRFVQMPRAGRVFMREPTASEASLKTLLRDTYRRPSRAWLSATPVVHARWRKQETASEQVAIDCAHVGVPAPEAVSHIRGRSFAGAASRQTPPAQLPERWRSSLQGPTGHLRIEFDRPVVGPLLLGRARHFGLGLMVPMDREETA